MWPEGREIAPQGSSAVAVCVEVGKVIHAIARDLPVMYEHSVKELTFDDSGRVSGVVVEGPDGEDSIAIHHVGMISLTWDHRAFDGAYAASFLRALKTVLETRDWEPELA